MHVWKIEPIIHTQYTNYIQKLREFNICISKQKVKELRGRKKLLNMKYKLLCHTVFRFYVPKVCLFETTHPTIKSEVINDRHKSKAIKAICWKRSICQSSLESTHGPAQIIFHVILFSHDRESHIRNT